MDLNTSFYNISGTGKEFYNSIDLNYNTNIDTIDSNNLNAPIYTNICEKSSDENEILPFNDNIINLNEEEAFYKSFIMRKKFSINESNIISNEENSSLILSKEFNNIHSKDDDSSNYEERFYIKRNKNKKKGPHTCLEKDNILRKIQVDYLSFIINFINDVINTLPLIPKDCRFKHLDYNIKKTVNKNHVENLKTMTIGDIVQMKATTKSKKINHEDHNKIIYEDILNKYPPLSKLFKKPYIRFFKDYYWNKNNIIEFNGKIIPLSPETQKFEDLLERNYSYADRIKDVAKKCYLNNDKGYKHHIFKTCPCF